MTNNPEPESTAAVIAQHGRNRAVTGSDLIQLAEFVERASRQWKEADLIPFHVLRALCRLTAREPRKSTEGFSALELQQEVATEKSRWAQSDDKSEIARAVRKAWKDLESKLPHKLEHLELEAARLGLCLKPVLVRREGGGTGNLTRYRLLAERVEEISARSPAAGGPAADIEYICEDIEPTGVFVSALARGYEPRGWRRWLYAAGGVAMLVFSAIVTLMGLVALYFESATGRSIAAALGAIATLWIIWRALSPLYRPLFVRIAAAPSWMQSIDDDRLLEFRKPPRHPRKALYAVRYQGTCPLCGGTVLVKQRRFFDSAELAGFCEEAPKAHVFSFDHVLRVGRRLQP